MKKITLLTAVALILILTSLKTFADTTYVAGTIVNETWTISGSPYCATDDLFISGLTIEPGVEVLFLGDFVFEIGGILTSVGTEQDSIRFNKVDTIAGWQGIYFNYSSPGSEIAYSRIEGSQNSGIRIINSEPIIRNSSITNNSTANSMGGGIFTNSVTYIENCIISNNSITSGDIYHYGAGIYSTMELNLIDCSILDNIINRVGSNVFIFGAGIFANGILSLKGCTVKGNSLIAQGSNWSNNTKGSGIGIALGSLFLENSNIVENYGSAHSTAGGSSTYALGGGIYIDESSYSIKNSIIANNTLSNSSNIYGGGIYCVLVTNESFIENSTIANNSHEGIYCIDGSNNIVNSIIWGNNNEQVTGSVNITYSDVQDGFTGEGNINLNPIFYNDTNLHIVPGSPCIDAGNPDPIYYDECFPPSQETELNDMGVDGGPLGCNWSIASSETNFLSFTFGIPPQTTEATIDTVSHTIIVEVENSTILTNLIATFTLSDGAITTIGGVQQISEITENDFTNPVTYEVTAEDGISTQDWVVTVDTATGIIEYIFDIVNIYPNPFSTKTSIEFNNPNKNNFDLSIFSVSGKQVFVLENIKSEKIEIKRNGLPKGVYILKMSSEKTMICKKLIIR